MQGNKKVAPITFEERYDSIVHEIEKRRRQWTLASTPFDDISQRILIKIHSVYNEFDSEKGEFVKWINRIISNEIKNALRDLYFCHSRPCIQGKGGCVFRTGEDTCSQTPSGKQCNQCPAYRQWEERKKSHNALQQPLPLENHMREADSRPSDEYIDFEGAKAIIEEEIKSKLNKHEQKLYKLLFVQNKDKKEVGQIMKYKPSKRMYPGYLTILKFEKKVIALSREIIRDKDLV